MKGIFHLVSFQSQQDRKFVSVFVYLSNLISMFWYTCLLFAIVFEVYA